jgi:hypothetical protein
MKHFLLTMSALSCLALSTHIAAAQEDPYPAPSLTSLTSSDRPDAWKIKNALMCGTKSPPKRCWAQHFVKTAMTSRSAQ